MRIVLGLLLSAVITSAQAERLFVPVYVKETTAACRNLASLEYRDRLIREQRGETLSGINSMSAFTGECGNAPEGQWMFLEGYRGNYVCLRPRVGADCAWVRRAAVGEIVELFPGRTFEQGNKNVPCSSWSQVVAKSRATEKDYTQKWRASRPANRAEDFALGVLTGALGVVTGGPDSNDVQHADACVYYFASAQEKARRLVAYRSCPALGANGQQEEDQRGYSAMISLVSDSCVPH
ncbi:MAG TPA: hypothetical protein VGC77_12350 [Rhodopseudomonas sp.]|uniref:hypothetical protein n=1 Tax=Rhodopseudomonas sp. TaxID=1078 RepID=UPI002EDB4608